MPLTYFQRKMSKSERNYPICDQNGSQIAGFCVLLILKTFFWMCQNEAWPTAHDYWPAALSRGTWYRFATKLSSNTFHDLFPNINTERTLTRNSFNLPLVLRYLHFLYVEQNDEALALLKRRVISTPISPSAETTLPR